MVCITLSLSVGGSVGTRGRGPPVERTLQVVGAFPGLGAQCPGGPPARRGPHFSREMGKKRAGGKAPWTPSFYSRSFPLAGFGVGCLWYGRRAIPTDMLRPIWDAFFGGKYAGKHFLRKKVSKSGRVPGPRNSPTTGTMWHNHQNERVPTSGPLKKGVRGASPRDSLRPGFL